MTTTFVACALLGSLALTVLFPSLRHRLRHGEWPTTLHRHRDPVQRVIGALMALLLTAALAWSILLLASPNRLGIWAWPTWTAALGWALLLVGTLIEVVGQLSMGASFRIGIDEQPTELVTTGVFRYVRNPIFTGLMITLLGFVLLTPSAWTIMAYGWLLSLIVIQVRLEEAHLVDLHGEAYDAYRRRVGRFVPGLGKEGELGARLAQSSGAQPRIST